VPTRCRGAIAIVVTRLCCICSAGQIEISAQNHNYAVDPASLPADAQVTHINLNDGTCAGLLIPTKKVLVTVPNPPDAHSHVEITWTRFTCESLCQQAGAVTPFFHSVLVKSSSNCRTHLIAVNLRQNRCCESHCTFCTV